MFERTDHHLAPWDLIGADQKRYARVRVLEVLNERVEQGMRPLGHAGAVDRRAVAERRARGSGWRRRVAERLTAPMRAAVLHSYGPPENLVVEDVPDPQPRAAPDRRRRPRLRRQLPRRADGAGPLPVQAGAAVHAGRRGLRHRRRRRQRRHRLGGRRPRRRRHRHRRLRRAGRGRRRQGLPPPRRRRPDRGRRVPDHVRDVVPRPQGPGAPGAGRDAARARRRRRRRPGRRRARRDDGRPRHRRRVVGGEARGVPRGSAPPRPSTTPTSTSRRGSRSTPAARASTSSTTRSAAP